MLKTYYAFICSLVVILLLLSPGFFTVAAQETSLSDRIKRLVDDAEKHTNKSMNPRVAYDKLGKAEKLASMTKKPLDLLRVYRGKALLYYVNVDEAGRKAYRSKIINILPKLKDSIEIAFTYEVLAVIEPEASDDYREYALKAYRLYDKHGKRADLIDPSWNLASHYFKRGNWEKTIEYADLCIDLIDETGKKRDRKRFAYLYLLGAYTNIGDFLNAKEMLARIDSLWMKAHRSMRDLYSYRYYMAATNFYFKSGQYKKAFELSNNAIASLEGVRKSDEERLGAVNRIENELSRKGEELKRFEVENKLKRSQIKIAVFIIIFVVLLLLFLLVFIVYLRKNAAKINALNKVLESKNTELNATATELQSALRAEADFLNIMTHELFTPINGISIIVNILKTENNDPNLSKNLELLEFSSSYLYRLLKNITDTKTIESGEALTLNRDSVRLKSFVKTISEAANAFFQNSTNTFQYDIDTNIPDPLLVDSVKLSQIIINLLNNADKYTLNGTVSLKVKLGIQTANEAKVLFEISDTGMGIDPDFMGHIFEKFRYGSDEIKKKYGGSGIGLYVVKHFLLLHNSDISVESEVNKGTKFSFSIWFEKVEKTVTNEKITNGEIKGSVLLVDDNKVNLAITKRLLESREYKCDVVDNGFDAIEMAGRGNYDIILMDIMMPGINGFETTNRIKDLSISTPVVALTAMNISQNKGEFDRTDFAAVMEKPFEPAKFFSIISEFTQVS